jgi:hypothetical protein
VIVIGCGVENLPGKACDCVQQIGAGYDSHEPFTAYHRQPFDPPVLHQGNDFLERRILGDGYRITRHDFGYPAAIFMNKIGRRLTRAEMNFRRRLRLRWVPISLRRMKSPSETIPMSFPAASTTGSPLMCRRSMMFAASTMVVLASTVMTGRVMI